MVLQVLTLMVCTRNWDDVVCQTNYMNSQPLRTIMNYQYRYGTTMSQAAVTLYQDGGYARYYSGLGAALVQGPVSRFGDTAADVGALAFLNSNPTTRDFPSLVKTAFAAVGECTLSSYHSGSHLHTLCSRSSLPYSVNAYRNTKDNIADPGARGISPPAEPGAQIRNKFALVWGTRHSWGDARRILPLVRDPRLPKFAPPTPANLSPKALSAGLHRLCVVCCFRHGVQFVEGREDLSTSECNENFVWCVFLLSPRSIFVGIMGIHPFRVGAAVREVTRVDGVRGLLGRGLKARILANGLQGLMFSVLWKLFLDLYVLHRPTKEGILADIRQLGFKDIDMLPIRSLEMIVSRLSKSALFLSRLLQKR